MFMRFYNINRVYDTSAFVTELHFEISILKHFYALLVLMHKLYETFYAS